MARVKFDTRIGRQQVQYTMLTATNGNVKVVVKLYGTVTDERMAREQDAANRRAYQLSLNQ